MNVSNLLPDSTVQGRAIDSSSPDQKVCFLRNQEDCHCGHESPLQNFFLRCLNIHSSSYLFHVHNLAFVLHTDCSVSQRPVK